MEIYILGGMDLTNSSFVCVAAFFLVFILFAFGKLSRNVATRDLVAGKCVVITGCDTGFGREIAMRLDLLGANVIATCLTNEGRAGLRRVCSSRLKTVLLDITQSSQIRRVYEEVKRIIPQDEGLWCLVNNAGIISWGPIEWEPLTSFKRIADINLWGMIDVTKTFLPLIKRARGRVVNFSSLNGKVTFANMAPYCITKYGVEAFSDALRREMRPCGVFVSMIEPGGFKTNLLNPDVRIKQSEALWNSLSSEMRNEYGENTFRLCQEDMKNPKVSHDLTNVVEAAVEAVTTSNPKPRYVIGASARFIIMLTYLQDTLLDKALSLIFSTSPSVTPFPGPTHDINKNIETGN